MSYASNPVEVTYNWPAQNFTSPITRAVKPPVRANRGRITNLSVSVTTLFTAVTTQGFVRVGTAGNASLYAELGMGTAAAGTAYNDRDFPRTIRSDIDMTRDNITQVLVATIAPTGGTPAGVGDIQLAIAWS
jgi:hypothetical protein